MENQACSGMQRHAGEVPQATASARTFAGRTTVYDVLCCGSKDVSGRRKNNDRDARNIPPWPSAEVEAQGAAQRW